MKHLGYLYAGPQSSCLVPRSACHSKPSKAAARRTSMIAGGDSDVLANWEREITEIAAFMIRLHRGQTTSGFSAQSLDERSSMRRGVCERPLQRMLMSRRRLRK